MRTVRACEWSEILVEGNSEWLVYYLHSGYGETDENHGVGPTEKKNGVGFMQNKKSERKIAFVA